MNFFMLIFRNMAMFGYTVNLTKDNVIKDNASHHFNLLQSHGGE